MPPLSPSHALLSGLNLAGRLTFGPRIAIGTQSEVYRAQSIDGRHSFAVKVVRAELATDPKFVGRFVREVRTLQKVLSPYVAKIVDFGVCVRTATGLELDPSAVPPPDAEPQARLRNDNEIVYVAYQWIDAEALDDRMARTAGLSGVEAVQLAHGVLDVLRSAHQAGLVHREVNPSNLLVADRGGKLHPWLIDFSVVQALSTAPNTAPAHQPEAEAHYTSPETARNESASQLADLWGLGVTLFRALTGRFPQEPAALPRLLADIAKNPPRLLAETDTPRPISAELAAFVDDLLAYRPGARLSTAAAALQRLDACPEADPSFGTTMPAPRPRAAAPSRPSAVQRSAEAEAPAPARTGPKAGGSTLAMPPDALNAALSALAAAKEPARDAVAAAKEAPRGGSTLKMGPDALRDALAARETANSAPSIAPVPARPAASSAQTLKIGASDLHNALAARENALQAPPLASPAPVPPPPEPAPAASRTGLAVAIAVVVAVGVGVAVWLLKK